MSTAKPCHNEWTYGLLLIAFAVVTTNLANASGKPSRPGARVYFVNLQNGETYANPVRIAFGLSAMGIAPAGVGRNYTGHHHLLIDRPPFGSGPNGTAELSAVLPRDEHHMDFCDGQTEFVLHLASGTHTLQLVLGDLNHRPHSPPVVSSVISINTITFSKDENFVPLNREPDGCDTK